MLDWFWKLQNFLKVSLELEMYCNLETLAIFIISKFVIFNILKNILNNFFLCIGRSKDFLLQDDRHLVFVSSDSYRFDNHLSHCNHFSSRILQSTFHETRRKWPGKKVTFEYSQYLRKCLKLFIFRWWYGLKSIFNI
jgi:hypothetical protein